MTSKINKDCKIKTPKSHSQDSIPSFIRKTYDILEERKFPDIIDWNPEGTALVIKKPTEFSQKVLPQYFKHNNLTSFVRQLNMYNFHKRRTQTLDHIYYHDLFQQGKKHLLKEIRRKGSDTSADKTQRVVESPEISSQGQDASTLAYENEFLKNLYNEAMSKISALESQVNEMTAQNQSLWSQVNQKHQHSSILKPVFNKYERQSDLTQEQLPMTFGDFSIPPLNLNIQSQEAQPMAKPACVNSFFNLGEEATESTATEVSQGSPSLQHTMESDKCFEMSDVDYLPAITLTPQISQVGMAKPKTDLFISRGDMSVGQLFDAWGSEEMSDFDQKGTTTQEAFQDSGLLGKRPLEQNGNMRFDFPEPALKRHELNIFSKKGMLSSGIEDRDMFKMMNYRDVSLNDEFDVDLMDFNAPFCGWAKTA